MAWNVWACDTVTGEKQIRLPVSGFPWARVLNGSGTGSATVQLNDSLVKRLNVRALTEPVARTLVLDWDDIVVYAGVIWGRKYSRNSQTLSISHEDIWSIINRRFAVNHYEGAVELWKATYSGMTLRQFIKYLMVLGLYGYDNSNMMLPITLPADEVGTVPARTIYGYHLENLGTAITNVMKEKNGPDVDFRPRWLDGKLNYEMRIGSTASPRLTAGSYEWNASAPESGIFDFEENENAQKLVTNMVAVGEGSEKKMLIRSERNVNPVYPHLERALAYKKESNPERLSALAGGGLEAYGKPTTQTSFSVMASGTPNVSALLPGGVARLWEDGADWVPRGWRTHRLIQYSGDLNEKVKLQFQPHGGE